MSRQPPAIQKSRWAPNETRQVMTGTRSDSSFWGTGAIVAALAILVQLPRLLSPQFGLLDDGFTIETTSRIASGNWDLSFDFQAGRFRPVYWLYYTAMYALSGKNPFGFYLIHTLLFAAMTFLLVFYIRRAGASPLQTLLTGVLFVFCSPAIENFYTLSKGEPFQLALVLLALIAVQHLGEKGQRVKLIRTALAALLLWMALATKETTLAVVPIAVGWLVAGWLIARFRREARGNSNLTVAPAALLAASITAVLLFALARGLAIGGALSTGTYANDYQVSLGAIAASAVRWAGWLLRGFPYALPLLLILVIRIARRPALLWSPFPWKCLIWMIGWVAVFLPWPFTQEYYMLPFAAGLIVLLGWAAAQATQMAGEAGQAGRSAIVIGLAVSLILWAGTLVNNYTNARIQLAVDRANAEVVGFLGETLPQGQKILLNIQSANEYTHQLDLTLRNITERDDLVLDTYQRQAIPVNSIVIMPAIENQPRLSVRLGVNEPVQKAWNEDLQSILATGVTQEVFSTRQQFQMVNIDFPRLLCPVMRRLDYCQLPSPLIDLRPFSYGWNAYQVRSDIQKP